MALFGQIRLGELRRRNIFKVSLAYALVSWLLVQIADVILPTFNAPTWVMQVLVLFLVLAFPIAVLLAWAYELTPTGLVATADVDRTQSITVQTGRKLNNIVVALLGVAVVFLIVDIYVLKEPDTPVVDVDYRRSIAVIPFVNRSADDEDAEFFSDGIHDELLTRLAQISGLRVISRTSVMEYRNTTKNMKQIGEELGVGSILEGAVQRSGDDLRINMQLIDTKTDEHIWADTFDRELTAASVFAIQSEISMTIADALDAELNDAEEKRVRAVPTESMDALEAYFQGKQAVRRRTPEGMLTAIEHFDRAVEIDPRFGLAWSGLAEAWIELPNYVADTDPMHVRTEATAATNRAIALNPDSPNAAATFGWHQLLYNHDWAGSEKSFRNALSLDATNVNALHWYSHLLSWQGQHEEAIATARKALQADPLSILMLTNLSYILADAKQWDEAFKVGEEALSRDAYSSLMANLWIDQMRARRPLDAAIQLQQWAAATQRDIEAARELGELIVRAQSGESDIDIPDDLIEKMDLGTELAEVYAAIGNAEKTIAALQNAQKTGAGFRSLLSMRINPSYDFVRDDPRFVALLQEIGLAD
jgi:TolB-like protein/tetratricopeptide (TPR) repeat protein